MNATAERACMKRNVARYPWFRFCINLLFWQSVWFLYFQSKLSASEAILLYVIYDVSTLVLEVPSGYMSDRLGRRWTLIAAAIAGAISAFMQATADTFLIFALAQIPLGASMAFVSGTDSSLLFESLAATGRQDDIERQELKAWRFSFTALALSAIIGGLMAQIAYPIVYYASGVAFLAALVLAFTFTEPPRNNGQHPDGPAIGHITELRATMRQPVLVWLFALSVVMYSFSHLPFVFGQPFILEALRSNGLDGDASLISGTVTSLMMILSVITSLFAISLRRKMGLASMLLLAFAMQIMVILALALTNNVIAIAILFLRMVPDSLSRPFIQARIQPLLRGDVRATYMSIQSFAGRLLLAATLYVGSLSASKVGEMPYSEIQSIMAWYIALGGVLLAALAFGSRRVALEPGRVPATE